MKSGIYSEDDEIGFLTSVEAIAEAVKESGNSAAKISILERAKNAEGSGTMAFTKMSIRANQLVEWVTSLISSAG